MYRECLAGFGVGETFCSLLTTNDCIRECLEGFPWLHRTPFFVLSGCRFARATGGDFVRSGMVEEIVECVYGGFFP